MGTTRLVITTLIATSACQRAAPPLAGEHARTDAAVVAAGASAPPALPPRATTPAAAAALTPALAPGAIGVQIIDREYGGFNAPGLPAIRGDGAEVVALSVADDGGRGWLSMSALVLDGKTGRVRERLPLIDADEAWDAMRADEDTGTDARTAALTTRIRGRVAALTARLATGSWRALTTHPVTLFDPDGAEADWVTLAEASYTLEPRVYRLVERRSQQPRGPVTRRHVLARVYQQPPPRDPDQHCGGDHAQLAAIHVDAATGLRLVEISFRDPGHNCGASGAVYATF